MEETIRASAWLFCIHFYYIPKDLSIKGRRFVFLLRSFDRISSKIKRLLPKSTLERCSKFTSKNALAPANGPEFLSSGPSTDMRWKGNNNRLGPNRWFGQSHKWPEIKSVVRLPELRSNIVSKEEMERKFHLLP